MEFSVGGNQYSNTKMPVRQQFHVARRMMQALGPLAKQFSEKPKEPKEGEAANLNAFAEIASAIGQMSDKDCDYILNACLATVQRKDNSGAWQVLMVNNDFLYKDISLPEMLQIAGNVVMDNLAGFSAALPQ